MGPPCTAGLFFLPRLRRGERPFGRSSSAAQTLILLELQGIGQTDLRRCPSFSFFTFRYLRVVADAGISSGSVSDTDSPYPCNPTNLRGLFVRSRIERIPRLRRIWAPMP